MNKLLKVVNNFGFFTKDQYLKLEDEKNSLKKQVEELPYDFDRLVAMYKPQQINALVYKAVNKCYNDEDKKFLLERFYLRIKSACANKGIKVE